MFKVKFIVKHPQVLFSCKTARVKSLKVYLKKGVKGLIMCYVLSAVQLLVYSVATKLLVNYHYNHYKCLDCNDLMSILYVDKYTFYNL